MTSLSEEQISKILEINDIETLYNIYKSFKLSKNEIPIVLGKDVKLHILYYIEQQLANRLHIRGDIVTQNKKPICTLLQLYKEKSKRIALIKEAIMEELVPKDDIVKGRLEA